VTAPRYMLDTDKVIYLRDGHIPRAYLERLSAGSLIMSIVSYGELYFGAKKGRRKHAMEVLEFIIGGVPPLAMDIEVARTYGELRAELEARGQQIGNNDLWIAAHALSAKLILVTNNEREFRRVPGLKIENWAA
jgi:tRNA(fMet)-specific endonuclease VapC